jgi:hypothetical protein
LVHVDVSAYHFIKLGQKSLIPAGKLSWLHVDNPRMLTGRGGLASRQAKTQHEQKENVFQEYLFKEFQSDS